MQQSTLSHPLLLLCVQLQPKQHNSHRSQAVTYISLHTGAVRIPRDVCVGLCAGRHNLVEHLCSAVVWTPACCSKQEREQSHVLLHCMETGDTGDTFAFTPVLNVVTLRPDQDSEVVQQIGSQSILKTFTAY